ncbi:MAG: cupin domain-containing protein, partial [Actinomycetota bacterium]
MIETPPSFAGTPENARGGHDVLAEMLRALRLTGAVFLNARFTAPFGIISPRRFDERTPMARMTHISIFHLMASGSATVQLANGERKTVSAGDILLVPFADEHKFWNGDGAPMAIAEDVIKPSPLEGMWCVDHGGGGEETRMVCGFIESSEFLASPVFRTLPALLIDR